MLLLCSLIIGVFHGKKRLMADGYNLARLAGWLKFVSHKKTDIKPKVLCDNVKKTKMGYNNR